MSYLEVIISGLVLGLAIAISVGPTFFAVVRYSTHHSYKAGVVFVLGISFSDILYVTLANLASNWLFFLEDHKALVGYIGSIFFILIGLIGYLKKYHPRRPRPANEIQISAGAYFKIWSSGFLMNALNPAAFILWITAAGIVRSYVISQKIAFFGACLALVLTADLSKVFLADKIRTWLTPRKTMYLNKISALCIAAFGVLLLVATALGRLPG